MATPTKKKQKADSSPPPPSSTAAALPSPESSSSTTAAPSIDPLSRLPADILRRILKTLTLKQTLTLSTLSHHWHQFCSTSFLFDLRFDRKHLGFPRSGSNCKDPSHGVQKFVAVVNDFVNFYNEAERVSSLSINFCLGMENEDDVDKWIEFGVRKGVEEVNVELFCYVECCRNGEDETLKYNDSKYVVRGGVFGDVTKVKVLSVTNCVLERGLFTRERFGLLRRLSLTCVPLVGYNVEGMVSEIVKLEELSLSRCSVEGVLCVGGLRWLKSLDLVCCPGLKEVLMSDNVCLERFNFSCCNGWWDYRGAPNLKSYEVYVDVNGLHRFLGDGITEDLNLVTDLTITVFELDLGILVPKYMSFFSSITSLRIDAMHFDILLLVAILRNFPRLNRLYLETFCHESYESTHTGYEEYSLEHLKEVEICGFVTSKNHMEFTVFLLKHAASLERLVIRKSAAYLGLSDVPWSEEELQKVSGLLELSKHITIVIK